MVCDFDGVIVDGINEYWLSSKNAYLKILGNLSDNYDLHPDVPKAFKYLRPWVEHGWEMVLLAAELLKPDSHLNQGNFKQFAANYPQKCKEALHGLELSPEELQKALNDVRKEAIAKDYQNWLNNHKAFPGVSNRLNQLEAEGIDLIVLTTKGAEFTSQLLASFAIKSKFIYGYESGSKTDVLLQLSKDRIIKGFIEDRRATLEKVINTPELTSIPCFLASWGYLKPNDLKNLPSNISLLEPKIFASPLANWN